MIISPASSPTFFRILSVPPCEQLRGVRPFRSLLIPSAGSPAPARETDARPRSRGASGNPSGASGRSSCTPPCGRHSRPAPPSRISASPSQSTDIPRGAGHSPSAPPFSRAPACSGSSSAPRAMSTVARGSACSCTRASAPAPDVHIAHDRRDKPAIVKLERPRVNGMVFIGPATPMFSSDNPSIAGMRSVLRVKE